MLLLYDLELRDRGRCDKSDKYLPIEPGDGIERWIEAVNLNPLAVGLEALDHHGLNKHPALLPLPLISSVIGTMFGLILTFLDILR